MPSEQPAFPQGHMDGPHVDPSGMSLRDYFAGQALAGVSGDNTALMGDDKERLSIAVWCYRMADAMLKARQL